MNPQVAEQVLGKDGKAYTVSTMRYRYDLIRGEIWETAVFEGAGCLTFGRKQRYTQWSFEPHRAEEAHAETVKAVSSEAPENWIMDPAAIKKERREAIDSYERPSNPFGDVPVSPFADIEALLRPLLKSESDGFIALLSSRRTQELRFYRLDGKGGRPVGDDKLLEQVLLRMPLGWGNPEYAEGGQRVLPLVCKIGSRVRFAEQVEWQTPYGAVRRTWGEGVTDEVQ